MSGHPTFLDLLSQDRNKTTYTAMWGAFHLVCFKIGPKHDMSGVMRTWHSDHCGVFDLGL